MNRAEPDPSSWNIASELCAAAETQDLPDALINLGLVTAAEIPVELHCNSVWYRGGAETYLFDFEIRRNGLPVRRALIKACTPFPGGTSIEDTLSEWLSRRHLLEHHGVHTPRLHYAGRGVIVEEFIPHSLDRRLLTSPHRNSLLTELQRLSEIISDLGFKATAPFSDLRSRGTDVVMVDFGTDLGPPHIEAPGTTDYLSQLEVWLRSIGLNMTDCSLRRRR